MVTLRSLIVLAVSVLTFIGCATATPYRAGNDETPGYRDLKIEEGKYRVTFEGNTSTPQDTVQNYLLYRASEVALEGGFDYFIVSDEESTAKLKGVGSGPSIATGVGFGARRGFSSFGLGYGPSNVDQNYSATAYVAAYKGKVPADNPRAYDAREVQKSLGPKIIRPK